MPSLLPLPIDDLPGFLDMLRQHNLVLRRQHTCLQQQSRGKFIYIFFCEFLGANVKLFVRNYGGRIFH